METGLIPPALIILLALISGYFSLMETALIECHRGRLEKLSEDGDKNATAVLSMLESPAPLSVAQIGITFSGILAGVCAMLTSPTIAGLINLSIIPAAVIALCVTAFIFLLFGILCTWNGTAMLSNSIVGLLVTAIHKEKAFRFLEYANYLWYVLLLIGVILTAVCYFHGEIWKRILKSIVLFWFGGVFLNSIPMLFINFAKEERKNL